MQSTKPNPEFRIFIGNPFNSPFANYSTFHDNVIDYIHCDPLKKEINNQKDF